MKILAFVLVFLIALALLAGAFGIFMVVGNENLDKDLLRSVPDSTLSKNQGPYGNLIDRLMLGVVMLVFASVMQTFLIPQAINFLCIGFLFVGVVHSLFSSKSFKKWEFNFYYFAALLFYFLNLILKFNLLTHHEFGLIGMIVVGIFMLWGMFLLSSDIKKVRLKIRS